MAKIIAARFETQPEADRALEALRSAGYTGQNVTSFYLNPPGQHSEYPIGGDAHHDEGTKRSGTASAAGAAVGGLTGLAIGAAAVATGGAAAVAAVAGAGVGAYVGSLAGGLSGAEAGDKSKATTEEPVERKAGIIVAALADAADAQDAIVKALRTARPQSIERADGEWRDGDWVDFDARRPAQLIEGR